MSINVRPAHIQPRTRPSTLPEDLHTLPSFTDSLQNILRTSCDPYAGLNSRQPAASRCMPAYGQQVGLGEISSGKVGLDLGEASDTVLEYQSINQSTNQYYINWAVFFPRRAAAFPCEAEGRDRTLAFAVVSASEM